MSTSNTQNNEKRDRASHNSEDADWVMVKEDAQSAKEDFELIHAAEARCWCGGSDADLCRQEGHTWPLCDVDQGEVWPELPPKLRYRPRNEKGKIVDTNPVGDRTTDKQSTAHQSKDNAKKPAPHSVSHPTTSYNSGPFAKLAILTDLLDPTRSGNTD